VRVAVIDADTILWVAAYYGREAETPDKMLRDLDNFLEDMLKTVQATHYCGFLKGIDTSHRHKMFTDYKANRPPSPEWLVRWKPVIQVHLLDKWKFELVEGMEVDDAVASVVEIIDDQNERMECKSNCVDTIVCSADKDLKQIIGWNYNTKSKELVVISDAIAKYNLCMQLLHGDVTDNIPNLRKGVGPATAKKMLDEGTRSTYIEKVMNEFISQHGFFNGLIKFSENVLKATLKRDLNFKFKIHEIHKKDEENIPTQ